MSEEFRRTYHRGYPRNRYALARMIKEDAMEDAQRSKNHLPGCAFDANKPHASTGSCMPGCVIGGEETRLHLAEAQEKGLSPMRQQSSLTVCAKNEDPSRPDINYAANNIIVHSNHEGKRFLSFICSDTVVTLPAERVSEITHNFFEISGK